MILDVMFTPGGDVHGEIIGFRPIVKDAAGKEPPLTRWGRVASGRVIPEDHSPGLVLNATGSIAVHPGVAMRSEIKLNELYDLSVPGKYTGSRCGPTTTRITRKSNENFAQTLSPLCKQTERPSPVQQGAFRGQ
jgi:hypothetical protein